MRRYLSAVLSLFGFPPERVCRLCFEVRTEQKVLDTAIASIGHSRLDIAVGIGLGLVTRLTTHHGENLMDTVFAMIVVS